MVIVKRVCLSDTTLILEPIIGLMVWVPKSPLRLQFVGVKVFFREKVTDGSSG